MRIKAVVAYDGSAFFGFQSQTTPHPTVLGTLQNVAQRLGITAPIVGSGRTDRGVHATGQVIHCDLPKHWQEDLPKLQIMFNRLLAPHIQIKHITPVSQNFHARHDAKRRIYRYLLKSRPPSPFEISYCHHLPKIDTSWLAQLLKCFEGTHDFIYFHKTGSDTKKTVRTIYRTNVIDFGPYTILYLEANGFLRAQVRMILGAIFCALDGNLSLHQITQQLRGLERHCTQLAPPQGLYLARIIY